MVCEATDAYDLVIFILFLVFDNDCCCRCTCGNYRIYLCALRFFINYFITFGQLLIIALTNQGDFPSLVESLNETTRALHNAAIAFMSVFGFVGAMFVLLAHSISSSGLEAKFGEFSFCTRNRRLVWPFLITSTVMMLMMDVFMFVFTTVYGLQQGEYVIDFTNFSDGFRSVVFLLSIFDMAHALVGIVLVIVLRKKVTTKVIPEGSTGTQSERMIYTLKKKIEYLKSDQFVTDALREAGITMGFGKSAAAKS